MHHLDGTIVPKSKKASYEINAENKNMTINISIALTGSQGSGKSTCIRHMENWFSEHYSDTYIIHSSITANGYSEVALARTLTKNEMFNLFYRYTERERKIRDGIHIFDRCSLDALTYIYMMVKPAQDTLDILIDEMSLSLKNVTCVIGLGIGEYYQVKTPIDESFDFRTEFYSTVRKLSGRSKIHFHDFGDSKRRYEDIIEFISRLM